MPVAVRDIMERASIVLQDVRAIRWPRTELFAWINDAQREIGLHKPSAFAETKVLELVEGSEQTLDATDLELVRVIRNIAGEKTDVPRIGGAAITPASRKLMDACIPGWTDPSVLAQARVVQHVIHDLGDPRTYFVVPPNDGAGLIEAIVTIEPVAIAAPSDPTLLASYDGLNVPVSATLGSAIVDYVVSRAFDKDMNLPGAAAASASHYAKFAAAIGLRLRNETARNLHAKEG